MKQSKRLLCVLLSMIMIMSVFTVGASAYKTNYQNPAGYDKINTPYFTNDQAATALLDYIDSTLLGPMNVKFDVGAVDIHVHIYSIDSLLDSLRNIHDSPAFGLGAAFNGIGELEDLNFSVPDNRGIRRRSTTMTDLEVFTNVLKFLQQNSGILCKLIPVNGKGLNMGIIDKFFDLYKEIPQLKDVHGFINLTLYQLLFDSTATEATYDMANSNLDDLLQEFINHRCIKFIFDKLAKPDGTNAAAAFLKLPINKDGTLVNQTGLLELCPSLKASDISITKSTTYDLISSIWNAALTDIVIPFAGPLILDLCKVTPDKYEDPTVPTPYVDMALGIFLKMDDNYFISEKASDAERIELLMTNKGAKDPKAPTPIEKTNIALEYLLREGIPQLIYFERKGPHDMYLTLSPMVQEKIPSLIKIAIPLLPTLVPEIPTPSQETLDALDTMNHEALFALLLQMLLDGLVDGVKFPKNCATIKELATYTLVNVAAELAPSIDFEAMIESGEINPNSDQFLEVAAVVIRYYVVGETAIRIDNPRPTFEEVLNDCFDYFLGKYATLFTIPDNIRKNGNIWEKFYWSVNQWIPLTNIFYGNEDSALGFKNLIMDSIVNKAFDFDVNGLLSIVGQRPDSDLMKPFSQLVANLLARVINSVFHLPNETQSDKTNNAQQKDLIIPYAYTCLDQITQHYHNSGAIAGCGVRQTVNRLLYYIVNITGPHSLCGEALDVLTTLIGVLDLDLYEYMKIYYQNNCPAGTSYSIKDLKALHKKLAIPENIGIAYDDPEYTYFRMVDYAPWTYLDVRETLRNAKRIIETYDLSMTDSVNYVTPARSEITFAYYALDHTYHDILLANTTTANNYQLKKVYDRTLAANYTNVGPDGQQLYTNRSWSDYERAIAFATKVMNEYNEHKQAGTLGDYKQSKVNKARAVLIDAVAGLKANIGDADYEPLQRAIDSLANLKCPLLFTNPSVKAVIKAYKEAVAFNNEVKYDADNQHIVDAVTKKLEKAYSELKAVPTIEFYDPTAQHLNLGLNYIYGFQENFYSDELLETEGYLDFGEFFFFNYAEPVGGDYFNLIPTENGNGTGAKLQVTSDPDGDGIYNAVMKEFKFVIFGDVNGDCRVDGSDVVMMRAYASFLLDIEEVEHVKFAGDVNFDDQVGAADIKKIEYVGVGKDAISQLPAERINDNITFLELINQK